MSRRLWANLLLVESNYFFTVNQEEDNQPTLLLSLAKNNQESLLEFLLRSKQEAQKQLRVKIQEVFLLVDLDAQVSLEPVETLLTSPSELHSNHKLSLEGKGLGGLVGQQVRLSSKLLKEVLVSTQKANLRVLGLEVGPKVVANYLSQKTNNSSLLILHTTPRSLNLLRFCGKRLIESVVVTWSWQKLVGRLQKSLQLSKKQVELFLLCGINLAANQKQIHSLFRDSVCVWHFKRFLGPLLKALWQQLKPTKQEELIVTGFLRTVGGLGEYLKRVFLAPYLRVETRVAGSSSLIFFLNQALNHWLFQENLSSCFSQNTGEVGLKLRRASRISWVFNPLNWFFFWTK